jgi:hypothetical protein
VRAPHPSPLLTTETAAASDYSLRREPGCWVLVFEGQRAYLQHAVGLAYVACLLAHPDEPVASATLFSEFSAARRKDCPLAELPDPETGELKSVTEGVGNTQLPTGHEEAEARKIYSARLHELKETLDDPGTLASERAEAQRLYDDLVAFLKRHYRPASQSGQAVTKLVHRSIQRLCENLRKPVLGRKVPDPAARAFAEYVAEHILVPSRRYTRAKPGASVRIARGELAGRLIFECPPGHRWSVRL